MADQRQYNYTLTELTRKLQRTSTVTHWFAYQAAEWSGLDDRHTPCGKNVEERVKEQIGPQDLDSIDKRMKKKRKNERRREA